MFKLRATTAIALSVAVDSLDYIAPALFAMPVLGDISDEFNTNLV
jgi:hypothetical protein